MEIPDEKLQELIKIAESGDSQAQYELGKYYWGSGFILDIEKAEYWFLKSAEQGLVKAQIHLAELYDHTWLCKEKDPKKKAHTWSKAEHWWLKAAELGNVFAHYMLGVRYDSSNEDKHSIIIKDDVKAVSFFTKAAEQGSSSAQLKLGCCYMDGRGVKKDWKTAIYWFGKAADQGDKVAAYKKALCEHERVIVYLDSDEYPNADFLTNKGIMRECEKLLGDDYKVIYAWGHMNDYSGMCFAIYGVLDNMSPYIVLYKNGVEVARSSETYKNSFPGFIRGKSASPSAKLADWIREKLK